MEWLDGRHPEYVDRLAQLAGQGRIEILGGPFYEPILAMIPARDRIGQIRSYSRWLQNRLGTAIRGMWIPERVWEQALARDLADAGIEYTILDDFHFKMAGLTDAELSGYLLTEDEGRLLSVFPGSERLRYLIPFGSPRANDRIPREAVGGAARGDRRLRRRRREVRHLAGDEEARLRGRLAGAVLRRAGGQPELDPGDHAGQGGRQRAAAGQSLPARLQLSRNDRMGDADGAVVGIRADVARDAATTALVAVAAVRARRLLAELQNEVPGSQRDVRPHDDGQPPPARGRGRRRRRPAGRTSPHHLYRGQCNCGYWHGAFGGIYLPHLRNAVYRSLIAADNLLDRATGRPETWVDATADDFNFDARQEVRLANDRMAA